MEALVVSRTWFDKFWTHEDICPRLKWLLDNLDEIREEFFENKDKLILRPWNYGLKRYQKDWMYKAYEGWEVAGLFAEEDPTLDWGNLGYLSENKMDSSSQKYKCTGTDDNILDRVEDGIGYTKNSLVLPKLTWYLRNAGVTRRAGISVTDPTSGIDWHVDRDPEDKETMLIRGLIGLDVRIGFDEECYIGIGTPKHENKHDIRTGVDLFFYNRVPHHVVNRLRHPRYCILIDVPFPKATLRNK